MEPAGPRRCPTEVMVREVNKMLGNAFTPVALDDSDWGEQLNSTKTVRQTMFSQGHIIDKKLGVKMRSLLAKGPRSMRLGLHLTVRLVVQYVTDVLHVGVPNL